MRLPLAGSIKTAVAQLAMLNVLIFVTSWPRDSRSFRLIRPARLGSAREGACVDLCPTRLMVPRGRSSSFCSLRRWPLLSARGGASGPDFEAHAFRALQIGNDLKQIAGGGIPVGAKHLVKSLYVELGMPGQLGESDRGIDIITQQFFAERHVSREKAFDRLAQKPLSIGGVAFHTCLDRFPKIPRQRHFLFLIFPQLLLALVVFPSVECQPDVVLLALFRSTAEKDDNPFALFAKVHAITRAEMDLALKNAASNTFHLGEVPQPHAI
jgi:hypothetical protein